jgi:hypothetical protein
MYSRRQSGRSVPAPRDHERLRRESSTSGREGLARSAADQVEPLRGRTVCCRVACRAGTFDPAGNVFMAGGLLREAAWSALEDDQRLDMCGCFSSLRLRAVPTQRPPAGQVRSVRQHGQWRLARWRLEACPPHLRKSPLPRRWGQHPVRGTTCALGLCRRRQVRDCSRRPQRVRTTCGRSA